ncbi:MAG: AtpZ/AtpI family protein [Syntrophales bacterium]
MDRETKRAAFRLAYASSIGISMVISIFGALYFGIWLDKKFGTAPWLTMVFLLMGVAAGFRNIYVMIRRSLNDEKTDDSAGKGKSGSAKNNTFSNKD